MSCFKVGKCLLQIGFLKTELDMAEGWTERFQYLTIDFYLSRFAEDYSQTVVLVGITGLTLHLYLLSQVFRIKRKGKITTRLCQSFQMLIFKW